MYSSSRAGRDEESGNSGIEENLLGSTVCYIGGVIKVSDIVKFKKLLIRTTRAQALCHDFDLQLPILEKIHQDDFDANKKIVVIAYRDGSNMKDKLNRIFSSFENSFFMDVNP